MYKKRHLVELQLFVYYRSEQCMEAYALLLALAETEQGLVLGQNKVNRVSTVGKYISYINTHKGILYS